MERKFKSIEIPVYEIGFAVPPKWCSSVCENALSDICMEECALKKDCSGLKLRKGSTLEDLPEFPLNEFINEMTPRQRTACVGIYLAKVTEIGAENGTEVLHRQGSRRIPESLKVAGVLYDSEGTDTGLQDIGTPDGDISNGSLQLRKETETI